jgi:hypothetical protein
MPALRIYKAHTLPTLQTHALENGNQAIRMHSLYLYSRMGIGTNMQPISTRSVLAQPTPRLTYITFMKSGSAASNIALQRRRARW